VKPYCSVGFDKILPAFVTVHPIADVQQRMSNVCVLVYNFEFPEHWYTGTLKSIIGRH